MRVLVKKTKLPFYLKVVPIQLAIIISVLCLPILFIVINNHLIAGDYKYVASEWNIDLPDNMKELYREHTKRDFQGKCITASVYDVSDKRLDIKFRSNKDADIEKETISLFERVGENKQYYPDFDHEYYWTKYTRDQNELIILLDQKTRYLYIVENLF